MMFQVFQVVERLISDALLSTKPNVSPILVTNNLYPFNCASLAPGMIFKQFDVQIVSEETAMSIQVKLTFSLYDFHRLSL